MPVLIFQVAACCGLMLLVASCASPPPRQNLDASLVVPSQWANPSSAIGEPLTDWVTQFDDPGLSNAVRMALNRNYDLQAAAARLDAALARSRIAGAPMLPSLDGSAGVRKGQDLARSAPGAPDDFDNFIRTRSTRLGLSFDITWELDVWGRLRAGKSASLADVQAAAAELQAARLSIAAQTAKAWYAAAEARAQVELALKILDIFQRTAKTVESRYEAGLSEALDLHLALSDAANVAATVEERRLRFEQTLRDLQLLLGDYPSALLEFDNELSSVPPPVPAGLPASLLDRRPDLIAAERRLAASDRRVAEARANRLPRISLTAAGGTTSDALKDLVDPKYTIWNLAANLVAPIFDGGRLAGEADLARANFSEALANYTQQALIAFREVEETLASEALLAERERLLGQAADQAMKAYTIAQEKYSRGLSNILEVLESQRRALQTEQAYINIKRLRLDNRINLHLALGGGFDDPQATPLLQSIPPTAQQ